METVKVNLHVLFWIIHIAAGLILAAGKGSSIGICYGMKGRNLPSPEEVVPMYLSYGIGRMRIYETNPELLNCLRGTGIEVMVGIRNDHVKTLIDPQIAKQWIEKHIIPYGQDVRFRYIVVGESVIPGSESQYVLRAIQNLHDILNKDHFLQSIKVSTEVWNSVLEPHAYPPSNATFSEHSMQYMKPIAHHLSVTKTPLLASLHPYYTYIERLKTVPSTETLEHGGFLHREIYDLELALRKVGAPDVQIVVSETGWPISDFPFAETGTRELAETYISYIIKRGTSPHRFGGRDANEFYLYSMFDEDEVLYGQPEKWGLFSKDKKLKFNISFT